MVRGRGYLKDVRDIEKIVVKTNEKGTPLTVGDIGQVSLGPEIRRGIADLDGKGDVVGGIVVMRSGENALNVIERVKAKLKEIEPSLPQGVKIVTTYDRSDLIERAVDDAEGQADRGDHRRLARHPDLPLARPERDRPDPDDPVSVILAFIPFQLLGLNINIMSLGGIAISIGVLVDGAIVEVENAYKKLQLWNDAGRPGDFHKVRLEALMEVGPSVFFSLLVIAVAFLPVFTLVDQEGRLFKPLAYSKNLAMAIAALLAITLDPAMRMLFARMDYFTFRPRWLAWIVNQVTVGKYYAEEKHPISVLLHRLYEPPCRAVLRHPKTTIAVALLAMAATVPVFLKLGSEFMPPLYEGSILYMPTTLPGHLGDRGRAAPAGAGQDPPDVPRGGAGLRQGGAGRDLDGPGAVLDDGDDRHPEARVRVADERPLVLVLGARVAGVGLPARLARPDLPRGAGRRDGRGPEDPGNDERLDDADQDPDRHALDRNPDAGRESRSSARTSPRSSGSAPRWRRPSGPSPRPAPRSPSASRAATSSTST